MADRAWRRWGRYLVRAALVLVGVAVLAAIPAVSVARGWRDQSIHAADEHVQYHLAHPGWSFPARIFSPATPQAEPKLLGWLVGPDAEIRVHLPLADAPKHLIDAIIVAEDRDFRAHRGVHLWAALRAAFADARERSWSQGGSTITMQVVRDMLGAKEKTLARKVREAVMAMAVDAHLGKDGVLQMYLDAPYLGQRGGLSICGFEAASQHYFGRSARELSLAQAATLAAILPAPAKFAPDRFAERARERRDRVLKAMAEVYGYDVAAALAEPMIVVPAAPLPELHPAYLAVTRSWLESRLSPQVLYGTGLVVTAAIDLAAQETTERLFETKTRFLQTMIVPRPEPLQSAAVLLDVDSGRLRAVWGGFGETSTGFNRATQARRQPGSAFKPLVYALALSQPPGADGRPRYTASSTVSNEYHLFKTPQGDWSPRNVTGEYTPTAALAWGIAWSQNVATASLLQDVGGPFLLIDLAKKLGFDTSRFAPEMGLALGQAEVTPLEMAQFAGTVANGGRRIVGTPVLRAVDAAGIERIGPPRALEQALNPEVAALTRELMRLVIDSGTGGMVRGVGGEAGYNGQALGKTGTTDNDVWFVGATPRWAAVVWMGYDQPQRLGGSAADLAAPLWGWWLGQLTRGQSALPTFATEPALTRRWICTVTGKLAGPKCTGIAAPFLPGTEPVAVCDDEHLVPESLPGDADKPKWESLWQKAAREKAEREADAGADR